MIIRSLLLTLSLLLVLTSSGCGLLYTDVRIPRAYRSATASDVSSAPTDMTVSGEACNKSGLFLIALGDASYAAAVARALEGEPDGALYDVKADTRVTLALLGLYARVCTIVTGKIAKP